MNDVHSQEPSTCVHCGLPLRVRPEVELKTEDLFCCVGCRMASSMVGEGKGAVEFLEARLLFSAFLAMGVMTFSLVLYGESVYDANEDAGMEVVRTIGRFGLTIFSLPVFLLLGVPLLKGAWLDLTKGLIRMDGLICLATIAAYGLSIRNTFTQTGEVYFDTATMVLVLVMFGRRLEAHSRVQGRSAASYLAELLPETAKVVLPNGTTKEREPGELLVDDLVLVGPGERIPADLRLAEGRSEVEEAHISGEHRPRVVEVGDHVFAGATNGTGAIQGRVLRTTQEGSLGRIRKLLDSPLGMTKFMLLADRLAGYLAFVSIALAAAAGWHAWTRGGAGESVEVALSVLLVACPCALGLATPLAYRAMRTALAKRGILVCDPRALEAGAAIDQVLLDKTGTLTESMGQLVAVGGHEQTMEKLSALVGASNHPLSKAVPQSSLIPASLVVHPGAGVSGDLSGEQCFAGSPDWMDEQGFTWRDGVDNERDRLAAKGSTLVAYAEKGEVQALACLDQTLKPNAKAVADELKARSLNPKVLSGDRPEAAAAIGRELGVETEGGLSPEDKLKRLAACQDQGKRVLVMGDGLNDAPMLRAADVAVAVAEGTAAARSQAGVEILDDDLSHLVLFLDGAKKLKRVAWGNIAWTVGYNLIALGLAASGNLHPLVAALLMIISSMVVCTRSFGLLSFAGERR